MQKMTEIDELIEFFESEIVVLTERAFTSQSFDRVHKYRQTIQALRQLKMVMEERDRLRDEIMKELSQLRKAGTYQDGLRRAAEIVSEQKELSQRCFGDTSVVSRSKTKQAILNEANNQQGEGE